MLLKFDVTAFCFFLAKNFSVFTCLQENYFYFSFNDFAVSIRGGASMTPEEIKEKKVEIVVSFLAVLELIRQGIVMARQENLFEGINIKSVENV